MARHLRLKHPKVFRQMQHSLEKKKKPVCGELFNTQTEVYVINDERTEVYVM